MSVQNATLSLKLSKWFCVSLGLLAFAGCGGYSQNDALELAIHRPADPEEETETPPPAKANQAAPQTTTSPAKVVAVKEPASEVEPSSPSATASVSGQNSVDKLSDTRKAPPTPLTLKERAELSRDNMQRIAEAMAAYAIARNTFPPQAVFDGSKNSMLSWRVELLPYLGYEELYKKFKLDQPWNSVLNKPLLEQIPSVYQSPERFDARTNYLVPSGSGTLFHGDRKFLKMRIEDGVEHTAVILEVDDSQAVPWTKPQEYEVQHESPFTNLGSLRGGYCFVGWGNGLVGAVSTSNSSQQYRAMFTPDTGDQFNAYAVSRVIDDDFLAEAFGAAASQVALPQPSPSSAAMSIASSVSPRNQLSPIAPSSTLAADYLQAAQASYQLGRFDEALLWYYAAEIVQPATANWHQAYQWIPALQRPSLTVHFGIGVDGDTRMLRRAPQSRFANLDKQRLSVRNSIGSVGQQLLEPFEEQGANLLPQAFQGWSVDTRPTSTSRRRARSEPEQVLPISYLGYGDRIELTRLAVEHACDVLVKFDLSGGPSARSPWIQCEVYDVARGNKLAAVSKVQWFTGSAGLSALERDEAFKRDRWALHDMLVDSVLFQEWPEGLKQRHALGRVAALADTKTMNHLAALAEMCVYRNRGLIDNAQLLDGFRGLLGQAEGEDLLLGSDKKRHRVLRPWLPADDPAKVQEESTFATRRNDQVD